MTKRKIPTFGKIDKKVAYVDRPGAYGFIADGHGNLAIVETSFGFFLPGGGLDEGEEPIAGLKREVFEELGWTVTDAQFFGEAEQYHWSEFYKQHFRKVGHFYFTEIAPASPAVMADEHKLRWWTPELAARSLTQEFQRWAVREAFGVKAK